MKSLWAQLLALIHRNSHGESFDVRNRRKYTVIETGSGMLCASGEWENPRLDCTGPLGHRWVTVPDDVHGLGLHAGEWDLFTADQLPPEIVAAADARVGA